MYTILDGKTLAEKILLEIKKEIKENKFSPTLAVVIVGNNSASKIYVENKNKKAKEIGINSQIISFKENISQKNLEKEIEKLSKDKNIHAILVQLPLPKHINPQAIIEKIPPNKDVDGFHPYNLGKLISGNEPYAKACTPLGIIRLLEEYNINIEGKNVVIVGRSNIVGKPLAAMFTNQNATVTLCHSKTKELPKICKQADILVCAIGQSKFFNKNYIKKDSIVIDVGINKNSEGKLTGDVNFENIKEKTSYITPVPKGIGPMTIAMLMLNTLNLYKNSKKNKSQRKG